MPVKNKEKLLSFTGIFLILACIYKTIFHYYNWEAANQVFFHFPLIVMWWMFFRPTLGLFGVGILSWISYNVANFGLIDDHLHHMFSSTANPQYTKLILYCITLFIMGIFIAFKKNRSTMRSFAFLSGLSCVTVSLLIHEAIPFTTLKWERELALKNMESTVNFLRNAPDEEIQRMCSSFNLKCELNQGPAVLKDHAPKFGSTNPTLAFESGVFHNELWHRQVYGLIKTQANKVHILIEDKLINESQVLAEETYGKLAGFANLIWGWLLLIIGVFHTSPMRKKVFNDSI